MTPNTPSNIVDIRVDGYPEPLKLEKEGKTWRVVDEKWEKSFLWWLDFNTYCAMAGQCRILWQQKVEDGVICVVFDRWAFHEAFVVHTPNNYKLEDMGKWTRISELRYHERIMSALTGKQNSPKERPFDNKMVLWVTH